MNLLLEKGPEVCANIFIIKHNIPKERQFGIHLVFEGYVSCVKNSSDLEISIYSDVLERWMNEF